MISNRLVARSLFIWLTTIGSIAGVALGMQKTTKKTALFYESESKKLAIRENYSDEIFAMLNQRWALMVLRELSSGRLRFNVLSKRAKINPNTLRDRLREMESLGIVDRAIISFMPPKVEYCLTRRGMELCCVFQAFSEWAAKYAVVEIATKPSKNSKSKQL